MQIDNEFEVTAPIERVWEHLLDVSRVAPCMPGAELTEVVDDRTWKGKVNMKIGPVSMSFTGTVVMQDRDDASHRVVLKAEGREQRGKGAASALATSQLESTADGTKVHLSMDLTITGAVAQYGRGMVLDISQRMTREFADCLQASLQPVETAAAGAAAGSSAEQPAAAAPTARPVRGFRLGLWALWRAIVRFFQRLFGRKGGPAPA